MVALVGLAAWGVREFVNRRASSAALYYEEVPPEVITSLGLGDIPAGRIGSASWSSRLGAGGG